MRIIKEAILGRINSSYDILPEMLSIPNFALFSLRDALVEVPVCLLCLFLYVSGA